MLLLHAITVVLLAACRSGGPGRRGVHITNTGGYLEFVARQHEQEQDSNITNSKSSSKETIIEQNIKLELDGYVYHPNFLEFTIGGLFGLIQEAFEDEFGERKRASSDDGMVVEFDLNARFLKKKKYPGTVFARRFRNLNPRPFQSSLETTTTNYGFVWQYVSAKTPMTLQFNRNIVELHPLGGEEEDGRQDNTLLRFETSYRFSDTNVLSLEYKYEKTKREPFRLDFDTNEVTLSHLLHFGPHHRHRLDSELNYFDQRGTYQIEQLRWRETLRSEYSDTLRTWLQSEVLDRTQGSLVGVAPIGERSYSLSGTIEHDLYDSLRSQLFVFGQIQAFDTGPSITRYGTQATFDYRKNNRWGVLLAKYRFRIEREDRSGGDQDVEVIDERHEFNDPEPVTLVSTNIRSGSIIIRSEDRFTLFQLGRDYTIRDLGNHVEIERVPTGHIADEQVVLLDYVYTLAGNFKLNTVQHEFSVRQKFDFGLAPYYRLLLQDQTITPTDAIGLLPENITAQTFGVDFERGALRLGFEWEDYESTINPFKAKRLRVSYTRRFKTGATGTVKLRWSDIRRQDRNDRRTRFFSVEGRYRHPITRALTLEGSALYRREKDSLDGDDEGIDIDFTLEWSVRQTELRLTYEYGRFQDDFSDNSISTLYVRVRRRF